MRWKRKVYSLRLAACDHDCSGPQIFLFIDPQVANSRTVKSDRYQRIGGLHDDLLPLLGLDGECAETQ